MVEIELNWQRHVILTLFLASIPVWFLAFDRYAQQWRHRWLGFVGGVATGYVTLYLLPKLEKLSRELAVPEGSLWDRQIHLMLTLGIVLYLLMEVLERSSGAGRRVATVFETLVHGSYCFLVGYIVIELDIGSVWADVGVSLVFGAHLLGMLHIYQHHQPDLAKPFAPVFGALVLVGGAVGVFIELPMLVTGVLTAFVAGIILINVVLEELPRGETRRFPWYLLGLGFFVAVLAVALAQRAAAAG